jgi:hypothetical protein
MGHEGARLGLTPANCSMRHRPPRRRVSGAGPILPDEPRRRRFVVMARGAAPAIERSVTLRASTWSWMRTPLAAKARDDKRVHLIAPYPA